METEQTPSGEPSMHPEQQPEQQKELFLGHLKDEIWRAAQDMGVELADDELRVVWQGPHTEEEKLVLFKLGDREARTRSGA